MAFRLFHSIRLIMALCAQSLKSAIITMVFALWKMKNTSAQIWFYYVIQSDAMTYSHTADLDLGYNKASLKRERWIFSLLSSGFTSFHQLNVFFFSSSFHLLLLQRGIAAADSCLESVLNNDADGIRSRRAMVEPTSKREQRGHPNLFWLRWKCRHFPLFRNHQIKWKHRSWIRNA